MQNSIYLHVLQKNAENIEAVNVENWKMTGRTPSLRGNSANQGFTALLAYFNRFIDYSVLGSDLDF